NCPRADMWDIRSGQHDFAAVRLYLGQRCFEVVGCEIDQQSVRLVGWLRGSCKASTQAAAVLVRDVVVLHVGLDFPAKHVVIKRTCLFGVFRGNLNMRNWMVSHELSSSVVITCFLSCQQYNLRE